ncbi:MAG: hypothetical protein JXA30_22165 [Deltaproteobacteria bacterium]|nr:hypothetical protein [Deltaproteobacteria bacterium]
MKSRKIGLKYCGGCKPEYDRVKAVALIKERLKGRVELVSYEDVSTEGTLVVTGCPTACVDLQPFQGRPLWLVTNLQEAERFIEAMRQGDSTP